ncbi:MAG: type II secretion system F family protein [Halovenus sp.]
MNPLWLLPSVVVLLGLVAWLGSKSSERIERTTARVGRVLFDRFVSSHTGREHRLEAAYIDTTYRTYATTSILYALLGLLAGGVAGAYIVAGGLVVFEDVVQALAGLPRTITRPVGIRPDYRLVLSPGMRWLVIAVGGLATGALTGLLAYVMRWQLPASDAAVRRRGINGGLPRMTAFMYALARGGMEFPQVLRTLTDNREVYGETADEMSVAVREMDLFGRDMITALRRMSRRTPSEQFKTFSENLTSVLQSGSDLSVFLEKQYERFRQEAKDRQDEVLELLATIAEGYVTVLVAGMLFLITILLVFGLTTTDTLWILQLLIYVMIPLGNAGFAVFLQQKLDALGIARRSGGEVLDRMTTSTPVASMPAGRRLPDGGLTDRRDTDNRLVLDQFDTVARTKRVLGNPLETFLWHPSKLLWITVPIALLAVLVRAPAAFQADGVAVRVLDDIVIQSVLFVLVTYAVVRQLYKRRIDRIEAATPELLERLASLNEAGMSVVEGFDRVRGSDLGVLSPEVERIWRDIEYGANIDDALIRFGRRVRTTAITRVVTLLTNAMRASGELGPVLRIAAQQARAEVDLRRQRRQQMFTYLIVIYVSFLVFLVIIAAVNEVLVPSLPDTVPTPQDNVNRLAPNVDAFSRFGDVDTASYTLVFFHAAAIQAACAGFIAGQLGEGSLRDGAKHAALMLTVAYIVFILLSAPVASFSVLEATSTGDELRIECVELSDGGFVAVYDASEGEGLDGELLGHTRYLPPGSHSSVNDQTGVVIPLQHGEITGDTEVRIVAHRDTNGNEAFDFTRPYLPGTSQTDGPYQPVADSASVGISVEVTYIGE